MLLMPNKKKIATLIVSRIKKPDFVQKLGDESKTGSYDLPEKEEEGMGLKAAMEDFLRAVEAKDARGMAEAFKAACECAELEPSDEYENEDDEYEV